MTPTPWPEALREASLVAAGRRYGHDLFADGVRVAELDVPGGDGEARTAAGTWTFTAKGVLRPQTVVTDADGREVATLRQKGLTGARGTVELADRTLASAAEGKLSDRTVLREGDRRLVEVARAADGERYDVSVPGPAAELLVLVGCFLAIQGSGAAATAAAASVT